MVTELAFVAGSIQNPRLVDLAEALALEVRELGLAATIEREAIPARKAGRVNVVLDPPRLAVGRRRRPPAARELAGAIAIWAGLGRDDPAAAGPAFDLDLASARVRRARGEHVEPLAIGQVVGWSASLDDARDIDLAVIGAGDKRSGRLLAEAADELSRWRVEIARHHRPVGARRRPGGI